nr:unnamed protein product [Digitaria exilis]
MSHAPTSVSSYPQSSLQLENRCFTYKDLEMITNNFQRVLGRGGFGDVYDGFLEDGTQVAVKLRSDSSNQGVKEFLAEYLHKGCYPPLVHRDVKASNILLNAKLEAKIADFGLSKAYLNNDSHLSTKSDVYSFGVVLLELVTGRPAIVSDPETMSIVQWARQRLARGNIEGVVDPRMRGDHDVNSVWKAADVALKCTAQSAAQRPTMTEVVAQLHECLELEDARAGGGGDANGGYYTGGSSSDPYHSYNAYAGDGQSTTDVSQTSTGFEVEHNFGRVPTMPTGPDAR